MLLLISFLGKTLGLLDLAANYMLHAHTHLIQEALLVLQDVLVSTSDAATDVAAAAAAVAAVIVVGYQEKHSLRD